jgi:hypothetical protein
LEDDLQLGPLTTGLDCSEAFVVAAGYDGGIVEDLQQGKSLAGKVYKVDLDGYDQPPPGSATTGTPSSISQTACSARR